MDIYCIFLKVNKSFLPGYIYAYLSSPDLGYPLLVSTAVGAAIPALWPAYLRDIPIVNCPKKIMEKIQNSVVDAFELRVEAIFLERKAVNMVENYLNENE